MFGVRDFAHETEAIMTHSGNELVLWILDAVAALSMLGRSGVQPVPKAVLHGDAFLLRRVPLAASQ